MEDLKNAIAKITEGIIDYESTLNKILEEEEYKREFEDELCEVSAELRKVRRLLRSIKEKL